MFNEIKIISDVKMGTPICWREGGLTLANSMAESQ